MSKNKINFSLEVFPPKGDHAVDYLSELVDELIGFNPSFVSVTCGAGGSSIKKTNNIAIELAKKTNCPISAHLTCIDLSKEEINKIAKDYWNNGVKHIVALRGDLPIEKKSEKKNRYLHASDLIEDLKKIADFEISVAGYPETHFEAKSSQEDLDFLKKKVEVGADRVLTQFFFDPDIFLRFRDKAIKKGIKVPIIPGLMPILNFEKIKSFAEKSFIKVPKFLTKLFKNVDDKSIDHKLLAMNMLSYQITKLEKEGVNSFHFYTLNKSFLIKNICKWIKEIS